MTAPNVLTPISPDSERGQLVTARLAANHAAVIARLQREGKPVPTSAAPTSEQVSA